MPIILSTTRPNDLHLFSVGLGFQQLLFLKNATPASSTAEPGFVKWKSLGVGPQILRTNSSNNTKSLLTNTTQRHSHMNQDTGYGYYTL